MDLRSFGWTIGRAAVVLAALLQGCGSEVGQGTGDGLPAENSRYFMPEFETRAGDGRLDAYWITGPGDGLCVDCPQRPVPVSARLFLSLGGPADDYVPASEAIAVGEGYVSLEGLENGRIYRLRLGMLDSKGRIVAASEPLEAMPGPLPQPSRTLPARQRYAPGNAHMLAWAPDGSQLAFVAEPDGTNTNVFVWSSGTAEIRQLTSHTDGSYWLQGLDWAPDGRSLLYAYSPGISYGEFDSRIYEVLADGSSSRTLSSGRRDGDPVWLSARQVLFTRAPYVPAGQQAGPVVAQLYRLDIDTPADTVALTRDRTLTKWGADVSPSTGKLVFSGRRPDAAAPSLFLLSPGAAAPRSLTTSQWYSWDDQPSWAPDGRHVVFVSRRSGSFEVWAIDVLSGRIAQITRGTERGTNRFNPRLSPDGRQLAFFEQHGGETTVQVIPTPALP